MAGFGFSEAQEMLRREVRNFAQKEIVPGARERAKLEEVPRDLLKRIGDVGFLGVNLPEKYGGGGADWVSLGIAMEELCKAEFVLSFFMILPVMTNLALIQSTEEVRQEWLPPVIRGEKVSCIAVSEPDCGSDAAAMKMRAVRDGDFYILNGEKTSLSLGTYADVVVLFAKTDPSKGAKGVSCFLVPLDLPGITISHFADMGLKSIGRASLIMDDVRVPAKYRLGDEGQGFYIALEHFDFMRIGLGLAAMAIAEVSLAEAMVYAKERTAFGKPIAKFEGISFKIAEAATLIEAGKLLCYRSFWLLDQGLRHTKEAAMCKWWCPKIAVQIVHDCLLTFGHVGYSEDHPVEQRLRDVIGFEIADGTAQIMKLIIARELLGREFLPY